VRSVSASPEPDTPVCGPCLDLYPESSPEASLPGGGLKLDLYPDESPELPISAYHDPDAEDWAALRESEPPQGGWIEAQRMRAEAEETLWDAQIESQFEAWLSGQIAGSEASRPQEPALGLPEFLDIEASRLRQLATPSASWLAAELEQLATEARRLETLTAEAFEHARQIAYWESARLVDTRAWDDGYRAGLAAGPGVESHHLA
jgi:hypothetical protein